MRPLLHFSEDPGIRLFRPHVARTSSESEPFVWAIDEEHAPSYWFPRDCPRACCWAAGTASRDASGLLALGGSTRLHAIEGAWLEKMRSCKLYVYELDAAAFELKNSNAGYWVAAHDVAPISVAPVGDLLARHVEAGIELRVVNTLWLLIDAIVASSLNFSIIRKHNAQPRES